MRLVTEKVALCNSGAEFWGLSRMGMFYSTRFLSSPAKDAPAEHLVELIFVVLALLALSGVTWHWLGGRETTGN